MPFVERQDIPDPITLRENDDRCICETDVEIPEPLQYHEGTLDVCGSKRFEAISAACDLCQEGQLGGGPTLVAIR